MKQEKRLVFVLITLFATGILLHKWCITRTFALFLTSLFLILISTLVLYHFIQNQKYKKKTILFLSFVFLFTVLIEIAGVKTGYIFGNYTYGSTLWPKIAGVPVVIGLNWILLAIASAKTAALFCSRLNIKSIAVRNIISGTMLVWIDYYIEPVAMKLDYWQWEQEIIPLRNYFAWFIISQIIYFISGFFKVKFEDNLLKYVYIIMLFYFILLKVILNPCYQ